MHNADFIIPDNFGNILCTLRCQFETEAHCSLLAINKIAIERNASTKGMILVDNKLIREPVAIVEPLAIEKCVNSISSPVVRKKKTLLQRLWKR